MHNLINNLLFFLVGEWKTFRKKSNPISILTSYLDGNKVEFFCEEITYTQKFKRWYVPNRKIKSYYFYTIIDKLAPDILKKKCNKTVILPDCAPYYLSFKHKVQYMLLIYLDIINLKLDQ